MTQPQANSPAIEAARSDAVKRRSEAADDFRRKEWLWEIALLVATAVLGGAIVLLLMVVLGVVNIQFSLERILCATGLVGLSGGGLLYLCRDRLFRLRNASNANLTSLSEAEGLRQIELLAINGGSVEVLNTVAQATVALTRGTPMTRGATNQTLELARAEEKTAPKQPETVFAPAALLRNSRN